MLACAPAAPGWRYVCRSADRVATRGKLDPTRGWVVQVVYNTLRVPTLVASRTSVKRLGTLHFSHRADWFVFVAGRLRGVEVIFGECGLALSSSS